MGRIPAEIPLLLAALALGSCHSRQEVCQTELPKYLDLLRGARISLQPWIDAFPKKLDRRLAAEGVSAKPNPFRDSLMAPADRVQWNSWALGKLTDIQRFMDSSSEEASFVKYQPVFHDAANQMVLFSGYADVGDVPKMITALDSVITDCEKISESCE